MTQSFQKAHDNHAMRYPRNELHTSTRQRVTKMYLLRRAKVPETIKSALEQSSVRSCVNWEGGVKEGKYRTQIVNEKGFLQYRVGKSCQNPILGYHRKICFGDLASERTTAILKRCSHF